MTTWSGQGWSVEHAEGLVAVDDGHDIWVGRCAVETAAALADALGRDGEDAADDYTAACQGLDASVGTMSGTLGLTAAQAEALLADAVLAGVLSEHRGDEMLADVRDGRA